MKAFCFLLVSLFLFFTNSTIYGLEKSQEITPSIKETQPKAPDKIEIKPTARDYEIKERLEAILSATGWFKTPKVQVKEGVVFLEGLTETEEFKNWAGTLARNTQDVSAVVNKIEIMRPSVWNFKPMLMGLKELWHDVIKLLPFLAFAGLIFFFTWFFAKFVIKIAKNLLKSRVPSPLLQLVIARSVAFCIFLFGLYIIFKIMGLTTVALTIIGGTGVLGIILGIAFRDITENLLASIFLSIHNPFKKGDLVNIIGVEGYVQRLTIRSTVLLSLDGIHLQIPNAIVYKSAITNYTINPIRRESFIIVIGYNEDIPKTQEIALKVLKEHPSVLDDPEPLVLVDNIEKATVHLSIYFWFNGNEHSWLKMRSSVIRLIKRSFQVEKVSVPGDIYQILLPKDIRVNLMETEKKKKSISEINVPDETNTIATTAEAGLRNESSDIQKQIHQSRSPEKGEKNLLNHKNS